jgi:hypothetical protein
MQGACAALIFARLFHLFMRNKKSVDRFSSVHVNAGPATTAFVFDEQKVVVILTQSEKAQ